VARTREKREEKLGRKTTGKVLQLKVFIQNANEIIRENKKKKSLTEIYCSF